MSNLAKVLLLFVLLLHINSSTTSPQLGIRDKTPSLKAFVNAKIIISPDKSIEKGMLLIEDGKILSATDNIKPPPYAEIINLDGYTIYPGFIDPYTSYGLPDPPHRHRNRNYLQWESTSIGASYSNDAVHADKNWSTEFKPSDKDSKEFYQNGFTVVQSSMLDGIFRGQSFVTLLGDDLDDNDLIINSSASHFCSFDKGSSNQEYPQSLQGSIAMIRQILYDVDWYKKAWGVYNNNQTAVLKPEFNQDLNALASYNKKLFIYDCPSPLNILQAEKIAREFNLDFVELGSGTEYDYLNELKEYESNLIIPLNFPELPEIKTYYDRYDVSLEELRRYELAPFNPAYLFNKKINFALTSAKLKNKNDFLTNLRKAVKSGYPANEALKALTVTPASICGVNNLCGTLEKGKYANFIITDGDIFNDEKDIYEVYVAGNRHQLKELGNNPLYQLSHRYILNIEKSEDTLVIEKNKNKYSGYIIKQADTLKLSNLESYGSKITFNVTEKKDDSSFVSSFEGRSILSVENDFELDSSLLIIFGKGVDPSGNDFQFSAYSIKETEIEIGKDSIESENDNKDDITLPKLAYPNKAFGYFDKPKQQNVFVKNITLWTSADDGVIEDCDVLIREGKIEKIGSGLEAPAGYLEINGTGKHMTAGIIDAHSHIAIYGDVNECTHAVTSEVRIGDVVDPEDINIYRQLAGGVTSSMLIHGSCNPIAGQAQLVKLRWGENAENIKFENSRQVIKFALGENVKRSGWGSENNSRYPQTRMGVETIIHDAFDAAIEYEKAWDDYYALSKEDKNKTIPPRKDLTLDAILKTIKAQYDIHCHAYVHTEMLMLMRLAEQFGFKVRLFIHTLEGYKVADEMAKHGAGASGFSDWWAYKFEVYDAIPYNSALMAEKGVLTSVNSDNADLARRLNLEAAKAIMYGDMKPEEAIKLVTLNPAIQMNVADRVGSIEIGKDADFVIWNGDPLSIYSKVEQTWIDGKKYFDIDRDLELQNEMQTEKNRFIQKYISDDNKSKMSHKRR